jgi:hypothetical protein
MSEDGVQWQALVSAMLKLQFLSQDLIIYFRSIITIYDVYEEPIYLTIRMINTALLHINTKLSNLLHPFAYLLLQTTKTHKENHF